MPEDESSVVDRLVCVEDLVQSLERSRRRWRTIAAMLGLTVLAAYTLGAGDQRNVSFDTVSAKEIRVTTPSGALIFSVDGKDGQNNLLLASPNEGSLAAVQFRVKDDQANLVVRAGNGDTVGLTSSNSDNFISWITGTHRMAVIGSNRDRGTMKLFKSVAGREEEKVWEAP